MRVLLDTNIIIHREAERPIREDIGILFQWLDRLKYDKCIHPLTVQEIRKHQDPKIVKSFEIKLSSYQQLKTTAPLSPAIEVLSKKYDVNENDNLDTTLLNEVYSKRVDILISEDKKIHRKAGELGIASRVFTIESFLEKVVAENPDFVSYKVLSVKKEHFGHINIKDSFFDSFKEDYQGFEEWFNRKADEIAYVCKSDDQAILAFLYLKVESIEENYSNIKPIFTPKKRLKIGTFKVIANGFKLGERFLKIIFDNAILFKVDEIYVTVFDRTPEQKRLMNLLEEWGFIHHGIKTTVSGEELVYTRDFTPRFSPENPQLTFPYFSRTSRKFIVPIYPEYHTELLPDSILNNESPLNFIENRPNRNAISKVYVSRSFERDLKTGDIVVFYRTKTEGQSARYSSVTTSIGLVQESITKIRDQSEFIELCKKRSVFSDADLIKQWNFGSSKPFIVNFLYVYALPKRLNLKNLQELGIILEAPRGFEIMSNAAFEKLMEYSNANQRFIVD